MPDLSALIERAEALTGPDREVDAEIARTFSSIKVIHGPDVGNYAYELQPGSYQYVEAFTSSLDAAIALVERVLPGWGISLSIGIKSFGAGVWRPGELGQRYSSHHPITPIALVLAALRALQDQEGRDG